jgi:hypothetical protein
MFDLDKSIGVLWHWCLIGGPFFNRPDNIMPLSLSDGSVASASMLCDRITSSKA